MLLPVEWAPGLLHLIANKTCIYESHRTVAHKEAVVYRHTCELNYTLYGYEKEKKEKGAESLIK